MEQRRKDRAQGGPVDPARTPVEAVAELRRVMMRDLVGKVLDQATAALDRLVETVEVTTATATAAKPLRASR